MSVWIVPLTAHSSPPKRSSDLAYGTESAVEVVRQDRLILGPATRICVETTLDPEAKRIVDASGQSIYPRLVKEITYSTTGRLAEEFRDRGWSPDQPRDRITTYIESPADPRACFDQPDTIQVRQRIVRGKSPLGYGVRLEARQGRRAYILAVERPYAVVVADEIRGALDHRVTRVPGTERPYWDPIRDCAVLADMFIRHLLKQGSKPTGETEIPGANGDTAAAGMPPRTSDPGDATPDKARIRRMSTAELEALIPGRRLMHVEPAGSSPGDVIVEEIFYKRPSAHALGRGAPYSETTRAYLVQYPSYRDGGDYIIRDDAICIIFAGRAGRKCRYVFKDDAGYYISGYDNSMLSARRVQIK